MRARVLKSTGSHYRVFDDGGNTLNARLRGKLRLKGYEKTNPVAVGDYVLLERDKSGEWLITDIEPRSNYIIRKSINLSHRAHILAANVDRALLIVSLAQPKTSMGFADRFLMVAEAYHIPAKIFINKTDLLTVDLKTLAESWKYLYTPLGYEVLMGSALNPNNLEEVKEWINGHTTLFAGHSGTGKSTLLNSLAPEVNARTSEVSDWSAKGRHTTTFAEMHPINPDTWIVDTPGIKEFGIVDFEKEEIGQYFPEIRKLMSACRFHNCRHLNEPGCSVLAALDAAFEGKAVVTESHEQVFMHPSRYNSYSGIYHGDDVHQ